MQQVRLVVRLGGNALPAFSTSSSSNSILDSVLVTDDIAARADGDGIVTRTFSMAGMPQQLFEAQLIAVNGAGMASTLHLSSPMAYDGSNPVASGKGTLAVCNARGEHQTAQPVSTGLFVCLSTNAFTARSGVFAARIELLYDTLGAWPGTTFSTTPSGTTFDIALNDEPAELASISLPCDTHATVRARGISSVGLVSDQELIATVEVICSPPSPGQVSIYGASATRMNGGSATARDYCEA